MAFKTSEATRNRLRRWYQKNREHRRAQMRDWYRNLPFDHKERRKQKTRDYTRKCREEFFMAYGGQCNCCGEKERAFLTLDHIFNDGHHHRKNQVGGTRTYASLRRLGWPKDRYQLLCMNCNFAKRLDECPHKKEP